MTNHLLDAVMAALVAAPLLAAIELVRERHRRHESRRLARAVVEAQGYARQVQSEAAIERADVEHALRILWRRIEVVTPADGAAVAVLRAAFPSLPTPPGPRVPESLPVPGGGKHNHAEPLSVPACPKCQDATCVAPGQCDDFFGGDAP